MRCIQDGTQPPWISLIFFWAQKCLAPPLDILSVFHMRRKNEDDNNCVDWLPLYENTGVSV